MQPGMRPRVRSGSTPLGRPQPESRSHREPIRPLSGPGPSRLVSPPASPLRFSMSSQWDRLRPFDLNCGLGAIERCGAAGFAPASALRSCRKLSENWNGLKVSTLSLLRGFAAQSRSPAQLLVVPRQQTPSPPISRHPPPPSGAPNLHPLKPAAPASWSESSRPPPGKPKRMPQVLPPSNP